jgi:hypothetical protein
VLRKIFGPKREQVMGGWRRLHNEELYNFHTSPNIITLMKSRRMKWVEHVTRTGNMKKKAYKILVVKADVKRPLGRRGRKWEDNIKMDLRERVWEGVDWMHLAQDRDQRQDLVNTVINLYIP